MNKPNDWDNVSAYGEFKPLPAGGYVCKVCKVEETVSKGGKEMLVILLDICEGEFAGYFTEQYKTDTRQDKKWGCVYYQLTKDYQDSSKTSRGFKTFVTSVKESNRGFTEVWGDKFAESFAGKLVGCIFRKEQYVGTDGNYHWNTKPYQFRSVETIYKGVEVPEDKYVDTPAQNNNGYSQSNNNNSFVNNNNANVNNNFGGQVSGGLSDFTEVISEGELPF